MNTISQISNVRQLAAALRSADRRKLTLLGVLGGAVVWAYWPILVGVEERWAQPEYSHGYLVPLIAVALLWGRRKLLGEVQSLKPSRWGLPVLAVGLALFLAGGYFYFLSLSAFSLLLSLFALCLLLGGWRAAAWAWPAITFLLFMIPLPQQLELRLSAPLQKIATRVSTYALQTLGFPAFFQGNVIRINDVGLEIVQACNGLAMLFVLLALTVAVAFVSERRPWERVVLALSAIPVALGANVIRITITGACQDLFGGYVADWLVHDTAGLLVMMPIALVLLWLECQFLNRLFLEPEPEGPMLPQLDTTTSRPANGSASKMPGALAAPAVKN